MIDWVWRYFTDAPSPDASGSEGQRPSLMSKLTGPVQLSSTHHSFVHICTSNLLTDPGSSPSQRGTMNCMENRTHQAFLCCGWLSDVLP